MAEFFQNLFQFLGYVWNGIGAAMRLDPRVYEIVESTPWSGWVILAIAMLGGASLLLGQSVILFVNRVKPGRFFLSLLLNGIIFTISLLIWAVAIWLIGRFLFNEPPHLGVVMRMVALGAAPYVYGFLVLIPYAGNAIGRILAAWSFLIVLSGINFLYPSGFITSAICVGLGWLLITLLSRFVGKPVIALRDRMWHRITGSSLDASVQDVLLSFSGEKSSVQRTTDEASK
jgi:hypothetical protein